MNLKTRTMRRAAAVTAAACAVLAVPAAIALAAPASPARSAGPAITPACETPGLVEWIIPKGAAAGSNLYTINFTNLSGHSCTLNGFPFLYAVGLSGHQIGHRARFSNPAPHQIVIASHGTASAALTIVDVLNFPRSRCHPVWAAGLNVFPPNQTRAKIIPIPFQACSSSSVNFMSVGAVKS